MLFAQKKTQYALRAIYELAVRHGEGPTKISDIARIQKIPFRFLEVILNQLKSSGIVESKRGFTGGYYLAQPPERITVGDILRFMQSATGASHCIACVSGKNCPFGGNCVFLSMWKRVNDAIFEIFNETTIQDLMDCGMHRDRQSIMVSDKE